MPGYRRVRLIQQGIICVGKFACTCTQIVLNSFGRILVNLMVYLNFNAHIMQIFENISFKNNLENG